MTDQPGPARAHIDSCDCSDCTAPPLRNQIAYALADEGSVWLHQDVIVRLADRLLPVVEAALDRSNRLAFQAGWNHAAAGWEQRAANHPGQESSDGDRRIVLEDEVDWHDVVQHPVWREGCAACVARAAWIEASQ